MRRRPSPITLFVFGFLGLGLGVYGLEFMTKYGDWLDKIKDWIIENPTEESYAKFFDSVGQGKMPTKLKDMAITYAINHPIDGMESLLERKIGETPIDRPGRKDLDGALQNFQAKKKAVDKLLEAAPTDRQVMQFDSATRKLILLRMKERQPK
jgi:hypothetical protein